MTFREYNPEASKYWVDERNNGLTPDNVSFKSTKTVYMRCPDKPNHIYQKKVFLIPGKSPYGCTFCSKGNRRQIIKGENDFFTQCKEAADMWDFEKNEGVNPETELLHARQKYWFHCKNGHSFQKLLNDFRRSPRCPECRKATWTTVDQVPKLMKQWNYGKNQDIDASKIYVTSKMTVWWLCPECGYEWQAQISTRNLSKGWCPCCENRTEVVAGITDLFTLVPEARRYYDFSKNNGIDTDKLSVSYNKPVNWLCPECGYNWKASVAARITVLKDGYAFNPCPACTGEVRTKAYAEEFPVLQRIFSKEKNGFDIMDIKDSKTCKTKRMIFTCDKCGEDYEAYLDSVLRSIKVHDSNGCPYCAGKAVKRENSFAATYPEIMDEYDPANEIDPYTIARHSDRIVKWICRNNQEHRWEATFRTRSYGQGGCPVCKNYNFKKRLFDVMPELEPYYDTEKNARPFNSYAYMSNQAVHWKCEENHSFILPIYKIVNAGKFKCPICDNRLVIPGCNSLADVKPGLAKEWSDKNDRLVTDFAATSSYYAIWQCKVCSGEFMAEIKDRDEDDDYCPYCAGKRALPGFNSLVDTDPEIAAEWSPNNEDKPVDVLKRSWLSEKWICPTCNGEYTCMIKDRTEAGNADCPYCTEKKVLVGYNSLVDTDPDIAAEWSPNNERKPTAVLKRYTVIINWNCPVCGGEYACAVKDRTEAGNVDCPYCTEKKVLVGYNSLVDTDPEIAAEWSPNNERKPTEVLKRYTVIINWNCPVCGGEYACAVKDRTEAGNVDCPYCSGRKALIGYNSLLDTDPEIAAEWSPNNEKDPTEVIKRYLMMANWNCPVCGGEYACAIKDRTEAGNADCPYCSGKKVLVGYNSLVDTDPEIAAEWSPRNENKPTDVMKVSWSQRKWICPTCNGEYICAIKKRTEAGNADCPYCAGRRLLPGYNSLADTNPELAVEWSPNNEKKPTDVLKRSWLPEKWICPTCNGEYICAIKDRTEAGNADCPYCSGKKVLVGYNSLVDTNPEFVKEWSLNNKKKPTDVLKRQSTIVKWICPVCKGEYACAVRDRTGVGNVDCPYCAGRRVLPGYNSFDVLHKDLMKEWNFVNNYLLAKPDQIGDNCTIPVWWNCPKNPNHRYTCTPKQKIMYHKRHMESCIFCKGRRRKRNHFV